MLRYSSTICEKHSVNPSRNHGHCRVNPSQCTPLTESWALPSTHLECIAVQSLPQGRAGRPLVCVLDLFPLAPTDSRATPHRYRTCTCLKRNGPALMPEVFYKVESALRGLDVPCTLPELSLSLTEVLEKDWTCPHARSDGTVPAVQLRRQGTVVNRHEAGDVGLY